MADSLEIIKTSPNSERERDKELAKIKDAVPVVSITRIDCVSSPLSKISPPASRNTDFSIENLLRKDKNSSDNGDKHPKSPKVQVTPFTPGRSRRDEADDGDDGTASVSSSVGSNCNSDDADEEYEREDVAESRFGSRRKRGALYDGGEGQDRQRKRSEILGDPVGGYINYQMHGREPNSGDADDNISDTGIEHQILAQSKYLSPEEKANLSSTFSWLTCTRFKPPKLPRSNKKRAGCKRYGRGPRIPFAPHQIAVLESTFSKSQYLSSDCIHRLADTLHLSETRVKIWFQNRRARYRREKEPQIGQAATMQLQQSHASPHQMRNSFRKSQLLLSTMPQDTTPKFQISTSPKPSTTDGALENTSPFSSSGGSDVQTDLDLHLQDQQAREAAAQRQHARMLLPNLMPFHMQSHHIYHQQQLHDYYLELNQHHGRSASNGSGNDDGIAISTSPLLHSALQQQYSIHNLSTHHNGGSSGRGRSSHSPPTPTGTFMDNYSMQQHRQQQYFHNLLRGSGGPVPFGSPLGAPASHSHSHGMQLSFPPAVKYA